MGDIEPQLGVSLTEEAEKWLAGELAAVEGRMEQSEQAAEVVVPEVLPQADAGPAVEEADSAPAPVEAPEESAKLAEPSPATTLAPPEEPKVQTIELSQSEIERLFTFLDEDGAGTLARDVLLNRLTQA